MARSHNQITLLGNVGGDPEVREVNTHSGPRKVANLSLATSPSWNPEKTEWHRISAWGNVAGIIEQYVYKGDRIMVIGRLQYSEWTDDAGQKRKTAEINVDDIVLLGSAGGATRPVGSSRQDNVPSDDDLPF